MPTKFSSLNFQCATALALSFVACMAVPTFAQQTVDQPNQVVQSQLCSTVVLGDLEYLKVVVSELHSTGEFSANSIAPAYRNIRCGEGGLTLVMMSVSSTSKNQRAMMIYLFGELFGSEDNILNETNYSGETDLDVIYSLGDAVSPRFVKKMRNLGAMTSCELSGECEYTGPNDSSRFTN